MRVTVRNILIAAVLLTLCFVDISLAQSSEAVVPMVQDHESIEIEEDLTEEGEYITDREYWKGYISDTKSIITSPIRWDISDWVKTSLVMGITLGLFAYDEDIRDWAQNNRTDTSDDIANIAKVFGDGRYTLPSLGVLYVYGHYAESTRARRTALLGLESFVIAGAFVQAMKFAGHRHRPRTGESSCTWDGPSLYTSNLSFPSGHAQAAFSLATVVASEYDDHFFVPPVAYGIATLTALSRVNDNAHWASDVFFGSAIGYFTAKAIIGLHESKKGENLIVTPLVNDKHAAVLITYTF